jgi:hypothetical protein
MYRLFSLIVSNSCLQLSIFQEDNPSSILFLILGFETRCPFPKVRSGARTIVPFEMSASNLKSTKHKLLKPIFYFKPLKRISFLSNSKFCPFLHKLRVQLNGKRERVFSSLKVNPRR